MGELPSDFRPTDVHVMAARLSEKAAKRLGLETPDWVFEVYELAERNGVDYGSRTA